MTEQKNTSIQCLECDCAQNWHWMEAFDKFGFGDGDNRIYTCTVEEALTGAGYKVQTDHWLLHNVIITSIKRENDELIPRGTRLGYDNPRDYLPEYLVELLDKCFPSDQEYIM